MWAVGDIVDTETGEIIVKAGSQIGDKANLIQQSEEPDTKKVTDDYVLNYLCNELEFKYVPAFGLNKKELEFVEERLMLFFPDENKQVKEVKKDTRHLPRFNTKNNEVPINDEGEISKFISQRWDKEATQEQKKLLEACLNKIKDRTQWYSHPDEVSEKDFEEPGLYFYRDKKTKEVKHGYIGIATPLREDGICERFKKSHYLKSMSNEDSLQKAIRKWLESKLKVGVIGTIEVIEQVKDILILNTIAEDDCKNHEQALLKFYIRLRPGNPPNAEKARIFFEEKFYDVNRYRLGRVGRFRLNRKFEQNIDHDEMVLRPEDFLNTMKYVVGLRNGQGEIDDIDHLGNRRVKAY